MTTSPRDDLVELAAAAIAREGFPRGRESARDYRLRLARAALAATRIEQLEKEVERLRSALRSAAETLDEAAIDVDAWGAYAGEYFQDKHDLSGNVAEIQKAAQAARAALNAKP